MRKYYQLFIIFVFTSTIGKAQIGGESTYEFLNLVTSARMAALGGNQIAINDSTDLNVAYNNPALLAPAMHNKLLMNYVAYLGGVNYGYGAYAFDLKEKGVAGIGIHYVNYGEFIQAGTTGEKEGTFTAAEYSVHLSWAKKYDRLQLGLSLKPILSSLESYQSFGLAADFGLNYTSANRLTNYALVIRNAGMQLTTYYQNGDHESLPFDVQLGFSKRLAHAPLRLSATLQHLQKWDLSGTEDEDTNTTSDDGFGKMFLRHLVLGAELLPSENFTVRVGYNYQRRQELLFDDKASTVGLSWGFGFKINRFHFDYGSARYHLAATSNHISVAIRLGSNL